MDSQNFYGCKNGKLKKVHIKYDFKSKIKKYIRKDTLETAKEDIITEEELQEEADLKDKK